MRRMMVLFLVLGIGCSGDSSDDGKSGANNSDATNNASNNSTKGTNSSTNGTNSSTNGQAGSNNGTNASTNNTPGTNGVPRDPFTGICSPPQTTANADGCTVFWRCSEQLTLECVDDGTGNATCACTKDGVAANSFEGPVDVPCTGDQMLLTQLAADQCSWGITYMNDSPLNCAPGTLVSGRAACSWTWDCDGTEYKYDCVDDRNGGFDCTCMIDNRSTGMAFPTNMFSNSEPSAIRAARAGCGWDIITN